LLSLHYYPYIYVKRYCTVFFSRAPGSRQNSPTEAEQHQQQQQAVQLHAQKHGIPSILEGGVHPGATINMTSLSLEVPQYEPTNYDPFQAVYTNHMMHQPPMESPNFGFDYTQQVDLNYET